MFPANKHWLAFRVLSRAFVPLVLPFGKKLPLYVLSQVLQPVVWILRRQCMIIQATMDNFSRWPSGPSPSKKLTPLRSRTSSSRRPSRFRSDGARDKRRRPWHVDSSGSDTMCPQPRGRFLGVFSGKLPGTTSATALPQRRNNLAWYPKDGAGLSKV